jgi:hypothetical protein
MAATVKGFQDPAFHTYKTHQYPDRLTEQVGRAHIQVNPNYLTSNLRASRPRLTGDGDRLTQAPSFKPCGLWRQAGREGTGQADASPRSMRNPEIVART